MALAVKSLQKTVAAAGTEEALIAATTRCVYVAIKAEANNTGNVFVGANPVTSSTGHILDGGEEVVLRASDIPGAQGLIDLGKIYIDVGTNGDGVSVLYVEVV